MNRLNWTMALAGAALTGLIAASPARAQTRRAGGAGGPRRFGPERRPPPRPRPRPKKAKKKANSASSVPVSVWNSRSADLTELQVAVSGSDTFKKVLGKLKAGKKTGAHVPKGKDCQIDLRATFADGQTTEGRGVDACADKVLNLTD